MANVHPSLLADIEKNGIPYQLYFALGLPVKEPRFFSKSIPISQVFYRLSKLFEKFTSDDVNFCNKHMDRRNSEVHTGKIPFDDISDISWQPQFYKACKILLETMDMRLIDLFGEEEADIAERLIVINDDKNASKIKSVVETHKKSWQDKSEDERQRLSQKATIWATEEKGHRVKCPACESNSLVFGEPVGEVKITLRRRHGYFTTRVPAKCI
ncbi:MAG: hypothetical protein ISN28_14595 [Ectothiorhodospiraceae bacterium AqS1]|nr:hypothetical protein [Ectothiorhodospiraceae bacterium AqS1]